MQEEELKHAVIDAMNAVLENSQDMIDILEENILEVIRQDNSVEIEEINNTIAEKQKKLLDLAYGKKTILNGLMKGEILDSISSYFW